MKQNKLQFLCSLVFTLAALCAVLSGCQKEEVEEQTPFNPKQAVKLVSYYPHDGNAGTQMIIRGKNFGYDASIVKVYIDNDSDRLARVISAKGDRIYAIIPARAGTGYVTVEIGEGDEMQKVQFGDEEDYFNYEFKETLTTLAGSPGEAGQADGSFDEAIFNQPANLCLDEEEGYLFVLEDSSKRLCKLDLNNETVTTVFQGNSSVNYIRTVSFATTRDTVVLGVEGGAYGLSGLYMLKNEDYARSKTFSTIGLTAEKRDKGSNAVIVNPLDGSVWLQCFYTGTVIRYHRDTHEWEEVQKPFEDNVDFTYCWSSDYQYLFAISKNDFLNWTQTSVIIRMKYDVDTGTLGEPSYWAGLPGNNSYGDGIGTEARFKAPWQMCNVPDVPGEYYVCDTWNHCIRKIEDFGGQPMVTTIAGVPTVEGLGEGEPLKSNLRYPTGIAANSDGTIIYVADKDNHRIVKISIE